MGWPNLTFADLLENATRVELEQFVSLLQGYLQQQHKEDGTHAAITADSIAIADPAAGSGNVTGDLIPAGTGQTLGTWSIQSDTVRDVLGWDKLYVNEIHIGEATQGGIGPSSGTPVPAWTFTQSSAGSSSLQGTANVSGAHAAITLTANGTTLATIGGSANIGTATALDGVTIPNLSTTQTYAANGFAERSRSTRMGEWITPTFAAGNFTASGSLTWTVASGDVTTYQYTLIGKTMILSVLLQTTSTSGVADTTLKVAIPGSFTANKTTEVWARVRDNGTERDCIAFVSSGGTVVNIERRDAGTFDAASTDATLVAFQIAFEVQ